MRVLLTVSRLGLELVKGLLRIGVVVAVYVVSTFAGFVIAIVFAQEGVQSFLLAAGAGLLFTCRRADWRLPRMAEPRHDPNLRQGRQS